MGLFNKNNKIQSENSQLVQNKKNMVVKIPKTVQQSIPYLACYPNGVIETSVNKYSKTYLFTDMNFKDAEEADQYDAKDQWGKILNLFSPEMDVQLSIFNRCIDESNVFNDVLLKPAPDAYNSVREEVNDYLRKSMSVGKNNLEREKTITVSFSAESIKEAMKVFDRIDKQLEKALQAINKNIQVIPMTIDKRLSVFYDIYNPYNGMSFERKYSGTESFSLENLQKAGLKTKDVIGCPNLKFLKNHIELGDGKYAKVFYLSNFPSELTSDFLIDISDQDCSAITSVHYKQLDSKKAKFLVNNSMTDINKDLIKLQKQASKSGYSASLVSPDLQQAQLDGEEFLNSMMTGDQRCFLTTIQIILFAESLDKLEDYQASLQSVASRYTCDAKAYTGQMENAFNSALPLAANKTKTDRLMQTDSAAIFIPFSAHDISQKDGIFLGVNQISKNIIRVNQHYLDNMNKMFLGKSGSGKSMQAKWEIILRILSSNDDIYIIDPDNEYKSIANLFKDDSEVIHLKPGATTWINPLDLDLDDAEDGDAVAIKCSFMEGFMTMVFGDNYVLSPTQKSILARCVNILYQPYLETLAYKSEISGTRVTYSYSDAPTLPDLYDLFLEQEEPEANQMALALERYCTGPNAIFAHKTNIDPKKRIVVYDIKDLGAMKELGLYICTFNAWNKTLRNKRDGKTTDIYIDEFHLLIAIQSAIEQILSMYKRARKFNGAMAGITQNITDLFDSPEATKILANCNFVTLMNQFEYDREQLAALYNFSDSEKKYITNAAPGTGLIKVGENVYPFENIVPTESIMFKVMSTKSFEAE